MIAAAVTASNHHGRIAIDAGSLEAALVIFPKPALIGTEMVEIVPGKKAAFVTVGKHRFDGVITDRLQLDDTPLPVCRSARFPALVRGLELPPMAKKYASVQTES